MSEEKIYAVKNDEGKVVLSKEQAEIVENAHDEEFPATYISDSANLAANGEEDLLMNAYVNGYTVEKDKKYLVYKVLGGKQDDENDVEFAQACWSLSNSETMFWILAKWIIIDQGTKFTEKEITDFGLQDCEKEEVTDDDEED